MVKLRLPVADSRPLTVLLAEDNAINQMVARGFLQRSGHRVVVANNGAEAVELIAAGGAFEDIRHLAHDLKGMAGYAGANVLGAQAAAIEEAARDGNRTEIRTLIARLEPAWAAASVRLQEHLAKAA